MFLGMGTILTANINSCYYNTKLLAKSKARRDDEARLKEEFKRDLFAENGLDKSYSARDLAFGIAWKAYEGRDHHAVVTAFEDMVPLVVAAKAPPESIYEEAIFRVTGADKTTGFDKTWYFVQGSVAEEAADSLAHSAVTKERKLVVDYKEQLYILGDAIQFSFHNPAKIKARAISKAKEALTSEEFAALGIK